MPEGIRAVTQELHYTSSPRGLIPGTSGFCTVAATPHMPGPLVERLESLSGYRRVPGAKASEAALDPVVHMHLRLQITGRVQHILSRIRAADLDHTQRSNHYAHHLVLDDAPLPEGGPAWLLLQPGVMERAWSGSPRILDATRAIPAGSRPPAVCEEWAARVGDAGWAGVVAESLLARPDRIIYLVFQPGIELLPLVDEVFALLPPERRWRINFSTYYTSGLPADVPCLLRGVLAGSDEAKHARRIPDALVIDLQNRLPPATGGDLVRLARTGKPRVVAEPEIEPPPRLEPASPGGSLVPPPLEPVAADPWSDGDTYGMAPPRLSTGHAAARFSPTSRPRGETASPRRSPLLWAAAGSALTLLVALGLGVAFWPTRQPPSPPPTEAGSTSGSDQVVQNSGGQDQAGGLEDGLKRRIEALAASKEEKKPAEESAKPDQGQTGGQETKSGEQMADASQSGQNPDGAGTPPPPTPDPPPDSSETTKPKPEPTAKVQTVHLLKSPLPPIAKEPNSEPKWDDLELAEPLAFDPKNVDVDVLDPKVAVNREEDHFLREILWDDQPLAQFRIQDRQPQFRWMIDDAAATQSPEKPQAVRDALITVNGVGGQSVSFLLRRRIDMNAVKLNLLKEENLDVNRWRLNRNFRPGLTKDDIWKTIPEKQEWSTGWPLKVTAVRIGNENEKPLNEDAKRTIKLDRTGLPPGCVPDDEVKVTFVTNKTLESGYHYLVYCEFEPSLEDVLKQISKSPTHPPTREGIAQIVNDLKAVYGGEICFKISADVGGGELVEVLRLGQWPEETTK